MEYLEKIEYIIALSFVAAPVVFLLGKINPFLRNLGALMITGVAGWFYLALPSQATFSRTIGGFSIYLGNTPFDWLFAALSVAIFLLTLLFSFSYIRERQNYFYFHFLVTFASVLGILAAKDFLSLFIFWEIMTWSSFMLVLFDRDNGKKPGILYFIFSASGAYAMLVAIFILQNALGSLRMDHVFAGFGQLDAVNRWLVVLFLLAGFGTKAAIMPLHIWAPGAYSESPLSFTAFFSGVLSKMGIFGLALVLFKMVYLLPGGSWLREALAWLGAITSAMATIYAALQNDGKKLLAFSSVAQLGYIITGLAVGTPLAVMAGIFMAIMHGIFKTLLFLAMGAVQYRTGMTNLDELTGLIRRMPVSFLAVLMGIITVAGLPPLGGFVGKWMLYESLIQSHHYFLVILTFFSSTAAYLYCYRLIFSVFLGQEEKEFDHIKEAPFFTMQLPMLVLSGITFVLGVFPGLVMKPIAAAMGNLGFAQVKWNMSVLVNEWGNHIDLITITSAIFTVFLLATIVLTFRNRKRTHYATTKDIHTAGEIPTENENLTFAVDFYQPYTRALGVVLKYKMTSFWNSVGKITEDLGDMIRNVYSGNGQSYVAYTLVFLAVLLAMAEWIF